MQIESVLVDARNFSEVRDEIVAAMQKASFVGVDTETHDDDRHEGLNKICGYDPVTRKKPATKKLVFDYRRTTMCGFSIYPEGHNKAYYVNLNHADVENRVAWDEARMILEALPEGAQWIAHNLQFELIVFKSCYGYTLSPAIDTLQMAVSAFGPDEYSKGDFYAAGQGGIEKLIPDLVRYSAAYNDPNDMPADLEEIVSKILAKQSSAEWSYNGWVKEIAYGYGLKGLVKRLFNYDMVTFDDVIGSKAHMGQLTGSEVASYGCDDAYWVVPLFHKLLEHMALNCPGAINTFFEQENPMVPVYADITLGGWRVDRDAVEGSRDIERVKNAQILRDLKAVVRKLLPFPIEPHEGLVKRDAWYAKNYLKYRVQIEKWANSPDSDDDFSQNYQVRGALSNAWAKDLKKPESSGPNLSHYMPQRTLIYDLARSKVIVSHGKTQSDGEARGRLKERFLKEGKVLAAEMIDHLNALASVDQRLKLFLTNYLLMIDPETDRMYPQITSMLATRRMAGSNPNTMQVAKRGESVYVRGFFEGDTDEHLIVSVDWSGIELVEIGEFSGDPGFIKAFGQLPHEDLHGGAAAAILSVPSPGMTEEIFSELKWETSEEEFRDRHKHDVENLNRIFTDTKGQPLAIDKAHKYWRTEVGKGANFNYWYSGALSTIGERMNWSSDQMWKATEAYRERFAVAEQWRVDLINEARLNGYVTLPDGHTRVRYEATEHWKEMFTRKFMLPNPESSQLITNYNRVWQFIGSKIQKRAFNQAVNAYIQGTCATIAKRSILRILQKRDELGWGDYQLRFLSPIHDELVWSVHKDVAVEAIHLIRGTMIDHPDLFKLCKLDASPAIGRSFEPFGPSVPYGQIEIAEAPNLPFVPDKERGGWMSNDTIQATVDYLMETK